MRRAAIAGIGLLLAAILAGGCATQRDEPDPADHSELVRQIGLDSPALPLAVSYRSLMTRLVGSSGFELFRLYESGPPLTDSDWTKAGSAAVDLAAIASLLSLPGRGKFDKQRHDDPRWTQLAADLQRASVGVATAAANRDRKALATYMVAVGDTCQACHAQFQNMRKTPARDMAAARGGTGDRG
jgi:Cytochrome C'